MSGAARHSLSHTPMSSLTGGLGLVLIVSGGIFPKELETDKHRDLEVHHASLLSRTSASGYLGGCFTVIFLSLITVILRKTVNGKG